LSATSEVRAKALLPLAASSRAASLRGEPLGEEGEGRDGAWGALTLAPCSLARWAAFQLHPTLPEAEPHARAAPSPWAPAAQAKLIPTAGKIHSKHEMAWKYDLDYGPRAVPV